MRQRRAGEPHRNSPRLYGTSAPPAARQFPAARETQAAGSAPTLLCNSTVPFRRSAQYLTQPGLRRIAAGRAGPRPARSCLVAGLLRGLHARSAVPLEPVGWDEVPPLGSEVEVISQVATARRCSGRHPLTRHPSPLVSRPSPVRSPAQPGFGHWSPGAVNGRLTTPLGECKPRAVGYAHHPRMFPAAAKRVSLRPEAASGLR
jgi:hypothetical protein